MFTIAKNFIHLKRPRGNKRVPSTYINQLKERMPLVPFRPSYINVRLFAEHRDCGRLFKEHYWLSDVRMFENPSLTDQLVRADYETLTIQLSSDVLAQDLSLQRDIFIRTICTFIAQRLFHDASQGEPYRLLVNRYSTKSVQTGEVKNNNKVS